MHFTPFFFIFLHLFVTKLEISMEQVYEWKEGHTGKAHTAAY